jgi:uncharacterized protein (DUF433 family)
MMGRITFNPDQCGGRPCIRGLRIRIKDVLDLLAAGVSEAEILTDYPDLEAKDIRASLAYAAEESDHPTACSAYAWVIADRRQHQATVLRRAASAANR